jgi:hypothetical protein
MSGMTNHLRTDPGFPPGCGAADCERGAGRLDDLPPAALWKLLDDRRQSDLYRQFFHSQWAQLAEFLDEPQAADAVRSLWLAWRNTAVNRLAMAGEIHFQH